MPALLVALLGLQLCFSQPSDALAQMSYPALERSGCCSHHGGVCGCSFGRAMCCDGRPSPSCGC